MLIYVMFNEKFFPHDLGQCKNSRKFLCSTATLFCCHYIHNFSSPHLLLFHNFRLIIYILLEISNANHMEWNLIKHTMTFCNSIVYKAFQHLVLRHYWAFSFKVHIFWEGHKILRNLHLTFDWHYIGQN